MFDHKSAMRKAVSAMALLVSVTGSASFAARPLDPTDPIDNLAVEMAMGCNSTDVANPQFYFWTGQVYSRRAGEPDRHIFNVQGVNPRACQLFNDPQRGGRGYKAAARELMLYLDPVSNQALTTWENPWTGESVEVVPMLNDPASMRAPKFPFDAEGQAVPMRMAWQDMGEFLMASRTRPFFRDSPLGGNYQDYVGGKYQVMETSTMTISKADTMAYEPGDYIPYVATWTRLSPWLPWMKMGGRDGMIILISQGRSALSFDDLPQPLRGAIENDYPIMKRVPEFDDERPFTTSWDSMKQWLDAQRDGS